MERHEAIKLLQEAAQQVSSAEALFLKGDSLAAIQTLLAARQLTRQLSAGMLTSCLERALLSGQTRDDKQDEVWLEELARLIRFAVSDLCLECRQQIGENLMEGE